MNWRDIKIANDNTYFVFEGTPIFNKKFIEVLKFHAPGLAPVIDESGAYHIDIQGNDLYTERYNRTFGYYCNRAAVVKDTNWFHINERGERIYSQLYLWVGNYQENFCTVRNKNNQYFHIDIDGNKVYSENYIYAGDFKDGIACVKLSNGYFKHIDAGGKFINNKEFSNLGVFHKNFATAKDEKGWFHIDKQGNQLYKERYLFIEPFYNGFALVETFEGIKRIIDEQGKKIIEI